MSEQNPKPLKKGRLDEVLQTEEVNSPRPALLNRAESELPAHERASNTNVPVTPGIHLTTYHDDDEDKDKEDRSTSPSYFTTNPANPQSAGNDVLPGFRERATSMSDQDTLRRMSLASKGRRQSITEIKEAVPELALTGNIISAAFNLPYALKYRQSGDWELGSRRGQSALYDAFSYLSIRRVTLEPHGRGMDGRDRDAIQPPFAPNTPPELDLEQQLAHDKRIKTVPVWLADDDEMTDEGITLVDQNRWRRYADHDLYTLFHYKQHEPTDGRSERVAWADYYRMNLKFANKIIEIYKPGDHAAPESSKYVHLLLSTQPLPSSEFLRCLPRRKEVLEGVLGANLVGFQSYSYSRHFSSCCTRILDFPSDSIGVDAYGTRVEVGVFPIGIDFAKVEQLAWSPSVTKAYENLKTMYQGKKIIVGRDRLDSVRGVAQKLMAFERFLELYPEWAEKVVLIQVTSPTNIEEDSENKIASRVNELVMRINGAFGGLTFSPVQHYPQYLSQDEYFALLRAADIGLITSVRDGMNTTSLEYVVCQRENHGPLILSEFSGTAGFLRDAIHINPWDLSGVAKQLDNALTMGAKERESMQKPLYNHVATQNVQSWITKFLRKLVSNLASNSNATATPLLDRTELLAKYRSAKKRLFMFDYDGTLTPIVREPSAAIPSERVIQTLKTLAADHRNDVWIISGRDQDAEHGSFMRHPGDTVWENLAEKFDMSWQDEVVAIFQKYTDRVHGSFIERKRCALTWHYRQADPEQGLHAARECQKELESGVVKKWDVDVMTGKANLEVRPTFINKGEIAKRLVNDYNKDMSHVEGHPASDSSKLEFVLCMGDDFTDEDMFRALSNLSGIGPEPQNIFTVTVGASTKVTLARWHILEPADVVEATGLLAGAGSSGRNDDSTVLSSVNLAAIAGLEGKVPES
ncbi:trehalose-phosphatase [Apiospora phragmitis]|uniref:Trehalose-phosphatase n=1 Tax=Apiospora phragmitis TaxID=2905665 RepID=A0ABR1TVB0_9PEZI